MFESKFNSRTQNSHLCHISSNLKDNLWSTISFSLQNACLPEGDALLAASDLDGGYLQGWFDSICCNLKILWKSTELSP